MIIHWVFLVTLLSLINSACASAEKSYFGKLGYTYSTKPLKSNDVELYPFGCYKTTVVKDVEYVESCYVNNKIFWYKLRSTNKNLGD